jgi:hypothetical protein
MRDTINEKYEELMVESAEADKLAMKLGKQFDKLIDAEVKKAKASGIEASRLKNWIQWKVSAAWGR